jgi:hypothetical protein
MKAVKRLASVWLIILNFPAVLYGSNHEKAISLQIENLTRWKNSLKAPAIQQSLGAILKPRQNYPRYKEFSEEMKQYTSIFKGPFLLLEVEPNDFGGFFALIVFKDYPKVLSLWIYEIDKNIFEVREVTPLKVTLNKQIMNELEDKRLAPFWLISPPPAPRG